MLGNGLAPRLGYGSGRALCYSVSGEGALLPGDRRRELLVSDRGGESSVARRPEETLLPRDRGGAFLYCFL